MYYVGFEFTIDTPLLNIKIIDPICEHYHLGDFITINFSHKLEPDIPIHYGFEAEKGFISGEFTMRKDSEKQYTVTVHTADVIRKKINPRSITEQGGERNDIKCVIKDLNIR